LEEKNRKMTLEDAAMRKELAKAQGIARKLEEENLELRKYVEELKHQIETDNVNTGDFHHSAADSNTQFGDPSNLINDLIAKEKTIRELTSQIEGLNEQLGNDSGLDQKTSEAEREKLEQEVRALKKGMEELKRKPLKLEQHESKVIKIEETTASRKKVRGVGVELVHQKRRSARNPQPGLKLQIDLGNQLRGSCEAILSANRGKR
jgi:hypothetical protein